MADVAMLVRAADFAAVKHEVRTTEDARRKAATTSCQGGETEEREEKERVTCACEET